jgi:predicted DNA-binding protein
MPKEESNLSFRIEKDIKNKLQKLASKQDRTLANYVRYVLKKVVEKGGI